MTEGGGRDPRREQKKEEELKMARTAPTPRRATRAAVAAGQVSPPQAKGGR